MGDIPLTKFLADPTRPEGTLPYHSLQGFLFAVAAAPDLVPPSEWLPEVFGGTDPAFHDEDEAHAIMQDIVAVYNDITAGVMNGQATLPADCRFRDDVSANLTDDAPISLWSRGFVQGYQWLEESWDPYLPDEMDEEVGALLMTLSFFATPTLAAAFVKECGGTSVDETGSLLRDLFAEALVEYARLGRLIAEVLSTTPAPLERRSHAKAGRNTLCSCGSGRKYKKCCGAG